MTPSVDTPLDFDALRADWQTAGPTLAPAEQIRDHVRRRGRWLFAFRMGDAALGLAATVALTWRAWVARDPWDQLAMGALALMTVSVMMFSWWNWRSGIRASAMNTQTFVAVSLERSRQLARYARAAWWVLGCEALVFVPWVARQLYGDGRAPSAGTQILTWGFLAGMLALGVWFTRRLQAWTRRDAQAVAEIVAELHRL